MFLRASFPGYLKVIIVVRDRILQIFYPALAKGSLHTLTTFDALEDKKPFKNTVGKGENAGYQHFLIFPHCFLPYKIQIICFEMHLICHLQMFSI